MFKGIKRNSLFVLILMISVLVSFELILGCGGSNDDNGDNVSNIAPILGSWERTEDSCTETLEFYNNKTFKISSYLELQTGIYELTKKDINGYTNGYTLSITILGDSGGVSCAELGSGEEAKDDTGNHGEIDMTVIEDQLTLIDPLGESLSYQRIPSD